MFISRAVREPVRCFVMSKEGVILFVSIVFFFPFLFSLPSHHRALPPLRRTDKDKCHSRLSLLRRGPKGLQDHIFLFLLFDDVILFSSEIDLSLMALFTHPLSFPPFPLFPLCWGKDGVPRTALSHYLEAADF